MQVPKTVRVAPDALGTLQKLGIVRRDDQDAPESIKDLVAHTYTKLYRSELSNPRFGHYPSTTPLLVLREGDWEWFLQGYIEELDTGHILLASIKVLARVRMPDIFH